MRISRLYVSNYRTLENLDLRFSSLYSAICGKNDSGKTNVVSAIRCAIKEDDPFGFVESPEFSLNTDFTKWVDVESSGRSISLSFEFQIDKDRDTGIYTFLEDYLQLSNTTGKLALVIDLEHTSDSDQYVKITVGDKEFKGLKAQEVLKKIQTSRTFFFHSSTDPRPGYYIRRFRGVVQEISDEHTEKLEKSKKSVNRVVKGIAKNQQVEIESLLGRLSQKYKVGVSFPAIDLRNIPYSVTLGDKQIEVELSEWGSGTRNRTETLLTIFQAKQISEAGVSASKVTPIIVIEEPESFLHPLAQAEFGQVLQDLSEEFQVQIIVTTHSPYLLSQNRPEGNILLERRIAGKALRETKQIDTSGENWMEPFALSLGIDSNEFKSWRDLFFTSSRSLLLVEGNLDVEYFKLLSDPAHSKNKLQFNGEIFTYGGYGNLISQSLLLRFVKDRFRPTFVTFDLDSEDKVEPSLKALGFEKKKSYLPIGIDEPGKRCIEGLLPEHLIQAVFSENPDLTQALTGSKQEREKAWKQLKVLLLERFKDEANPGNEYYGSFYPVVKILNRAFN